MNENKLRILTHHYPGYGGPPSWTVRAIYDNRELSSRNNLGSEFAAGQAEANLKAYWLKSINTKLFLASLGERRLASDPCSHCGQDTLDGTSSIRDKVFCTRKPCQEACSDYSKQCHTEAEGDKNKRDREYKEYFENIDKRRLDDIERDRRYIEGISCLLVILDKRCVLECNGFYAAWQLRAIANELDKRNKE